MTIFKPREGEAESFITNNKLNIKTNTASRCHVRSSDSLTGKHETYANIVAGRSEDGKQLMSTEPTQAELRKARHDKGQNESSRRKSTRPEREA